MDLSVLSAEIYYDGHFTDEARSTVIDKNSPATYYGGIVLSDDTDLDGSQDVSLAYASKPGLTPQQNPRRVGRGSGDEVDGKKRRGRPRINPSDETTSNRRRTQIRLAQRAYRSRKENTISSFRDRVTKLERTLTEMNNLFVAFNDSAIEYGVLSVMPQLAVKLEQTTERFAALTRTSVYEPGHGDHQIEDRQTREYPTPKSDIVTTRSLFSGDQSSGNSSSRTSSRPASVRQPHAVASELIRGEEDWPELLPDVPSDRSTGANFASEDTLEICTQIVSRDPPMQYLGFDYPEMSSFLTSTSPMLDLGLQTSITYSFRESTFARRLHRASLERAYCILTSPHSSKEEISRIFGLCFHYKNIESIVNMLRRLLKRSCTESLDNWAAPFHHLGGAGTHYPRLDVDGNQIPLPNMRTIGPSLHQQPEISPPKDVTTEHLLRLIGWDGVWLDPYDVEQYLSTEIGLRVDGQSTFAEMTVPLDTDPTADPASLTDSSMDNVTTFQGAIDSPSPPEQTSLVHDFTVQDRISNPFEDPTHTRSFTIDHSKTSQYHATLTIDLNKLLSGQSPLSSSASGAGADTVHTTGITQRCVYIGRCPGFRKADIDSALHAVMQRAF